MSEYDPDKSPNSAQCPRCGGTNAEAKGSSKIRCKDCGKVASYREW